ncbi:hypothetical protein D3C79_869850 [compost metagenome]
MQDVHISQVFQRRLVDAGIVVLGSVEAEQDVIERLAILVERLGLGVGLAVLAVETLDVLSIYQQQDSVLLFLDAIEVLLAELGHAFQQTDVDQAQHAINDLLFPVDDRGRAVVMD